MWMTGCSTVTSSNSFARIPARVNLRNTLRSDMTRVKGSLGEGMTRSLISISCLVAARVFVISAGVRLRRVVLIVKAASVSERQGLLPMLALRPRISTAPIFQVKAGPLGACAGMWASCSRACPAASEPPLMSRLRSSKFLTISAGEPVRRTRSRMRKGSRDCGAVACTSQRVSSRGVGDS